MNKLHKYLNEFVVLAKNSNYRVFIAESGRYGLVTDTEGLTTFCFAVDGLRFNVSGNYKAVLIADGRHVGSGWRISEEWITNKTQLDSIFNAAKIAPKWATGGKKVIIKTLEQHLADYGKTSKYAEILDFKAWGL